MNASLLPARHNLALLLAADKARQAEAISLLRENLRGSADYLPSRLSLAETLAASGDNAAAIEEYRRVLADKPAYVAARLALAQLLVKTGNAEGALAELRTASTGDAQNPDVLEQIGDLESGRGRKIEALAAYDAAAKVTADSAARKRLGRKIRALN